MPELLDDLLEERLARLESGEPLETCIDGLPEEAAALVEKAARLQAAQADGLAPERAAAQRSALLDFAKEKRRMDSQPTSRPRWLIPIFGLSGAMAAMLVCAVVVAAASGFFWLWQRWQTPSIAHNFTAAAAAQAPDSKHAVLANSWGRVEVRDNSGAWAAARTGEVLQAGQHIRTGELSSATLITYDGSQVRLGANSELSVDILDAQRSGARVIVLTQWQGDSQHAVAKSSDPASRYEVHTPSGVGTAKGTLFRVVVSATLQVRFDVDEGVVDVTSLNTSVLVVAGQSTVIVPGQPPIPPVFRITGEGLVEQTGATWKIAGRSFLTDANTVILGHPEIGDWVAFEGRLLADNSSIADRIVFLGHTPENQFTFTGKVEALGATEWTVAGHALHVDDLTAIDGGIAVGDTVEVRGDFVQDGTLRAASIHLIADDAEGFPFDFAGIVNHIAQTEWTISGVQVKVDAKTQVGDGLTVGDVVRARGRIQADGTWLAASIERAEADERKFSITGKVDSLSPWVVQGIGFETSPQTEIDDGIKVGDRVLVEGRILEDGRWVAASIKRLETNTATRFEFVGKVTSLAPWIVGGVTLATNAATEIDSGIVVGDIAQVSGQLLEDGSWLAEKIKRVENGQGCLDMSAQVVNVQDGQLVLANGQTIHLNANIQVTGDLTQATVVIVRVCTADNSTTVIVSIVVVFTQSAFPTVTVTPTGTLQISATPSATLTPAPTGAGDEEGGGKVTVCHKAGGKNPHTITISRSALAAHLGHGDTLGPCP